MKRDIEKLITDTDKEIGRLKILKAKQEEMKKLQAGIDIAEEPSSVMKPKKERKHKLPTVSISSRTRKAIVSMVAFCLVSMLLITFVTRVEAANPVVAYTSPADTGTFASTNDGDGVSWVINVSDADSNLAEVELWSNSSGSWALFYDSGALGGVAFHNTSGQNGNWTGSWTTYWWNISANDGTWTNVTYSFTTAYQWGDPQMAVLSDAQTLEDPIMLKNTTGDYYLWYNDGSSAEVKTSNSGTNWSLESESSIIAMSQISGGFTYDNSPYFLGHKDGYLYYCYWDGGSWQSGSAGIDQYHTESGGRYSLQADSIYYNGVWNMISGFMQSNEARLRYYTGIFPSSWSYTSQLETTFQYNYRSYWYPSLAVLNGIMHLIHKDAGSDLHWRTYDGASWTDRLDIGGDSLNLGGGATSDYRYYGCSMVKDPVNQQLVCVYIDNSGDLRYRVTDNLTSWSDSQLILSKGGWDIRQPHIKFMDSRLVMTFSYNLRGNYNIYTMSSPDYSGSATGLNYTLNRIQWPDASPGDTNVNSTIFSLKNLDNRDIKTIMWHIDDLGEITSNANFEMWTNMSGSWASIGTTDATGNITTLDISGEMAGGGEWEPGMNTWWKLEILAVGSVSEDIHSCDESIYYRVTF